MKTDNKRNFQRLASETDFKYVPKYTGRWEWKWMAINKEIIQLRHSKSHTYKFESWSLSACHFRDKMTRKQTKKIGGMLLCSNISRTAPSIIAVLLLKGCMSMKWHFLGLFVETGLIMQLMKANKAHFFPFFLPAK